MKVIKPCFQSFPLNCRFVSSTSLVSYFPGFRNFSYISKITSVSDQIQNKILYATAISFNNPWLTN